MIRYVGPCLHITHKNKTYLVIGDLHFGYEDSLVSSGVFVSSDFLLRVQEHLTRIFEMCGNVSEVILLGDVKHSFGRILRGERRDINLFFAFLRTYCRRVVIVKGNHDVLLAPLASDKHIFLTDFYVVDVYCFFHGDKDFEALYEKDITHWIIGHGHPAVYLQEGVKKELYKCFLTGTYEKRRVIIVPSFFSGSVGTDPRRYNLGLAWNFSLEVFRVHIVSENGLEVFDFGLMKDL